MVSCSIPAVEVGAEHVGRHGRDPVGLGGRTPVDTDFPTASIAIIITSATRDRSAGRVRGSASRMKASTSRTPAYAMLPGFRRVAIERRGVAERQPQGRLLAL